MDIAAGKMDIHEVCISLETILNMKHEYMMVGVVDSFRNHGYTETVEITSKFKIDKSMEALKHLKHLRRNTLRQMEMSDQN